MGTGLVYGDEVTLEYFEPSSVVGQGAISISKVVHGYRFITPPDELLRAFGDAGTCTVNTICEEGDEWRDELKGVGMMLIGSTRWCSGSLIYTTWGDCIPYFLTANHCINGHDAVDDPDASEFNFYWRYESPDCGHNVSDGPTNMSTAGATVVASSQVASGGDNSIGSDFALLLLTENPITAGYDVYLNGWDKRGPDSSPAYAPTACNGIHHPRGDVKKISTDVNGAGQGAGIWDEFWELFWEPTTNGHSVTEGGSSGSPLFDASTKRIIGQLFGGSSLNCTDPTNDLGRYGGIFYSFENVNEPQIDARRLAPWLDPGNTGLEFIEGSPPCTDPFVSILTTDASIQEGTACDTRTITVDLQISLPATGDTDVTLSASGSADGNDYTLNSTTVTFPDGSTANQSLTLDIVQDALVEGSETIVLDITLVTGSNALMGSNSSYMLTIDNDDLTPGPVGMVLEEDFENGLGVFTSINDNGAPSNFILGNTGSATSDFWTTDGTNTSQFAFVNEDACNCNSSSVRLVSSALDFSTYSGGIELIFDHAFANISEIATVIASTNGSDFTPISTLTNVTPGGTPRPTPWVNNHVVNLNAYAGESTVYVGFSYNDTGTWAYGMAVDNIIIKAGKPAQSALTTNPEANLGPNATVHFYEPITGHLVATIENLSSHDYGCTTINIDRAGTSAETCWETGKTITTKTFRVIPQNNNPTGSYRMTLYYNEDEIAGWENADGSTDTRNDLLLIKTPNDIDNGDASNYETQTTTMGTLGTVTTFSATFNSGFSGFSLGNVTPSVVLPLNLLSFEAMPQKNHIALEWATAQEVNHKGFYLERSTNSKDFEAIDWIAAKESEQTVTTYTYQDTKVRKNTRYYYRLRQIDNNNSETLSLIRTAQLVSVIQVQLMPNPVSTTLMLDLTTEEAVSSHLKVVDVLGQIVYEQKIAVEGQLQLPIAVEAFATGVYWLQLQTANEVLFSEKFVKR